MCQLPPNWARVNDGIRIRRRKESTGLPFARLRAHTHCARADFSVSLPLPALVPACTANAMCWVVTTYTCGHKSPAAVHGCRNNIRGFCRPLLSATVVSQCNWLNNMKQHTLPAFAEMVFVNLSGAGQLSRAPGALRSSPPIQNCRVMPKP